MSIGVLLMTYGAPQGDADLPRYLAARNLALVEDVGADTYRERYLTPRGRGAEPLSEYQRAALAKVGASS